MENKLYIFFNKLYNYFKVSVYYWLYLFRGIIIYGIFPATLTLFAVVKEMKTNEIDDPKELFAAYHEEYKGYKLPSFIFFMIMILLYGVLLYLNYKATKLAVIFKVLAIYLGSMAIILLPYIVNYMIDTGRGIKESLMISFVTMIRNIFISIWILIFTVGLIFIGFKNLVILVFIIPFVYALGVDLLLMARKTTKLDK